MLPNTIFFYWKDKSNFELVRESLATWPEVYRDFSIQVFDHQRALEYFSERISDGTEFATDALFAYNSSYPAAMKSDIFRVFYGWVEGGLYADATVFALRPLSELVDQSADFMIYRAWHGSITNKVFWSPKQSPFLIMSPGVV